jgi:hypothetical protein
VALLERLPRADRYGTAIASWRLGSSALARRLPPDESTTGCSA